MKMRFFDFEVTPNWWLCVFGDLTDDCKDDKGNYNITEDVKQTFVEVHSDMPNARDVLLRWMREQDVVLVGYNIKCYDLIIANAIYQGFTPQQIKIVNDIIINPSCAWSTKEHIRMAPFAKKRLSGIAYLDLFDSSDGTLKDKEATFGLSILESAVPFDKEDLTESDKEDLKYYCRHDVYAAMTWYIKIVEPFITSKLLVCKHFGIEERLGYIYTNAQLVGKALGAKRTDFADSERVDIELHPKIRSYIYENLPSNVVNNVLSQKTSYELKLYDNIVTFADGGIHSTLDLKIPKSVSQALYVSSDDEWVLMNVDASSYYPAIMIQLDTLSRSIKNKQLFIDVFNDRVAIKHKSNPTKDDKDRQLAYKLILNTTYGAGGCEYLDLCDKYHRSVCCRYGQLLLAALANKLYNSISGLSVIQTNTDGILIYCRKKDVLLVDKCRDEWSKITGIGMDTDLVEKIWQRDVNNYLMVKEGGKIKRKGGWLIDDYIKPGYIKISPLQAYACGKAAIKWLVNGDDVIKSLVQNKTLSDFAITCKKGPTFRGVIHRMSNGEEIELFKTNRVIAVKNENYGKLYKYKMYKDEIRYTQMPDTPEHCMTINEDLNSYTFDDLRKDLDYMYYYVRTVELLDLEWRELKHTTLTKNDDFKIIKD